MKASWTAYYVGHGALNYIEIKDDNDTVIQTIVIDAGSTQEALGGLKEIKDNFFDNIYNCEDNSVILCLTHADEDHYSFFVELMTDDDLRKKVRTFYVASAFWFVGDSMDPRMLLPFYKSIKDLGSAIKYLQVQEEPQCICKFGNCELWLLFHGICDHDLDPTKREKNANSANYLFKVQGQCAIWFTGDSTGWTFARLNKGIGLKTLRNKIKDLLSGCPAVYITVPHHGSLDSLGESNFVYCGEEKWHYDRWKELCNMLGITQYAMVASFGADDKFQHPNGLAMNIYAKLVPISSADSDIYMVYYGPGQPIKHEVYKIGLSSYAQLFKGKRGVFVTCTLTGQSYESKDIPFEWEE